MKLPMASWWHDTLFKRLFLLMWVALVLSHMLAFFTVRETLFGGAAGAMGGAGGPGPGSIPVFGSLPPGFPTPGMRDGGPGGRRDEGPGGPGAPPPNDQLGPQTQGMQPPGSLESQGGAMPPQPGQGRQPMDSGPPGGGANNVQQMRRGLPAGALWLDYGIRFIVIGIAAWFGARWLTAPVRRLAQASVGLGHAMARREALPKLDEKHGTLEVRQAAQLFNTMAQQLRTRFDSQALLMAAISHDLRTPLARLRMRLEDFDAVPRTQRCIDDVKEMDALIGSVLGMIRDQQPGEAQQRLNALALAQAMTDDLADEGHAVTMSEHGSNPENAADPAPESPLVLARPVALKRVLGNLVGNALRHAGNARVSVNRVRPAASGESNAAEEVHFIIDDDGPGIPEDQLEAVFEPFHRADASRQSGKAGSGLGLYIARDLIERDGGKVSLSNRPGGGLRALVSLPAA